MYRHKRESTSGGCLVAFGLVFTLPGLMGVASTFSLGLGAIPFILFGGFFSLIGIGIVAYGIKMMLANTLFENLDLETPRPFTKLGEKFSFSLSWTCKKNFRVDSITVKYFLEERAVLQRGTKSTTFQRKLYEQERKFDLAKDFQARENFLLEGEFQAPLDGPSSFSGKHNFLIWKIEVTMDVPNWPDPSRTWEIPMRPYLIEEADGEQQEASLG